MYLAGYSNPFQKKIPKIKTAQPESKLIRGERLGLGEKCGAQYTVRFLVWQREEKSIMRQYTARARHSRSIVKIKIATHAHTHQLSAPVHSDNDRLTIGS